MCAALLPNKLHRSCCWSRYSLRTALKHLFGARLSQPSKRTPLGEHTYGSHTNRTACCWPTLQAIYRCHDAAVLFIGFLSDAATMITVDQRGLVALWPAGDDGRSGVCLVVPHARCTRGIQIHLRPWVVLAYAPPFLPGRVVLCPHRVANNCAIVPNPRPWMFMEELYHGTHPLEMVKPSNCVPRVGLVQAQEVFPTAQERAHVPCKVGNAVRLPGVLRM